jgi:hypothetical protein
MGRTVITDRYEKWQEKVDELMLKGDYRSANDLCGAIFFIYQVDKIFNQAINGSEVWSNGLYVMLTYYTDCLMQQGSAIHPESQVPMWVRSHSMSPVPFAPSSSHSWVAISSNNSVLPPGNSLANLTKLVGERSEECKV